MQITKKKIKNKAMLSKLIKNKSKNTHAKSQINLKNKQKSNLMKKMIKMRWGKR